MTAAAIKLPPKLLPVFSPPRGSVRYRGAYGGRGSGKSFSFAKMALVFGVVEPLRFLCTRALQVSIKDSFFAELKNAVTSEPWLEAAYDVGENFLRSRINETEFLFKGLQHNITAVKSTAQIDICIVEEAEDVAEHSWLLLEPTIRAPKSEIWVVWNPEIENSPVDTRFRKNTPERAVIVEMNYTDNPWFPHVLEELRRAQQKTLDPETYAWVWKGQYLKATKSSILGGHWEEGERQPDSTWHGPYHGLDFGFADDPSAAVKVWVSPDETELYVEAECGGMHIEQDDLAGVLKKGIPGIERHVVVADSARPETIAHLKRERDASGRPKRDYLPFVEGAVKGPGSVEDGISYLTSMRIIVNPSCTQTIAEMGNYRYKVDRLTGDVLPVIIDKHNHYIDAIRYAVEKIMKAKMSLGLLVPRRLLQRR